MSNAQTVPTNNPQNIAAEVTSIQPSAEKAPAVETIQAAVEKAPEITAPTTPPPTQDDNKKDDPVTSIAPAPVTNVVDKTTETVQTQKIETPDTLFTKADTEENEFIEEVNAIHEHN